MQVGPSHLRLALSRPYPGTPGLPVVKPGHGRLRARDELEEATWFEDGPEGRQQLAPVVKMRLTSPITTQDTMPTRTIFTNATCLSIVLLKLNRRGDEEFCAQLDPWVTSWAMELPIGTVLIAREARTGARLVLGRRSAHVVHAASAGRSVLEGHKTIGALLEVEEHLTVTVAVDVPPRLEWTPEPHRCFPAAFRQRVRALLLAMKHLETNPAEPTAAATPPGAPAAGTASIGRKQSGAIGVLPPQVVLDIIGRLAHSSELVLANMHHPLPAGRRGILPALLAAPPAANIPRVPVAAAADMGAGASSSTPAAGLAAPGAASSGLGAAAGLSSAWSSAAGSSSDPGVSGAAGLTSSAGVVAAAAGLTPATGHSAPTAPAAFVPAEDDHVRAYNQRIEGLMEHAEELELAQEQRELLEERIRQAQYQRRLAEAQAQMMAYMNMSGLLRWQ